jgi:hypothetical protein
MLNAATSHFELLSSMFPDNPERKVSYQLGIIISKSMFIFKRVLNHGCAGYRGTITMHIAESSLILERTFSS